MSDSDVSQMESFMSQPEPFDVPPKWITNTKDYEPKESTYILAFFVKNERTGKSWWQIEKLDCRYYDEDGMRLQYCGDGEDFSDWNFEDAEFYIECED